ncbi:MAG: hypothetical protein ACLQVI_38840 [Polyangiaceae bacterium]
MIHPFSLDLRERAVALLDEGLNSLEVADLLGVSDSWVRKMRLRREALGHLIPGPPPRKERLLSEESLHAREAHNPEIQRERERFVRRRVIRGAARLLFLDETGIDLSMTRAYARAASVRAIPFRRTGATASQ